MEYFQNLQNTLIDIGFTVDNSLFISCVVVGVFLVVIFFSTILSPFYFFDLLDEIFRQPILIRTTDGFHIRYGIPSKFGARNYARRYNKKHKNDKVLFIYSIKDVSYLPLVLIEGFSSCTDFKLLYVHCEGE